MARGLVSLLHFQEKHLCWWTLLLVAVAGSGASDRRGFEELAFSVSDEELFRRWDLAHATPVQEANASKSFAVPTGTLASQLRHLLSTPESNLYHFKMSHSFFGSITPEFATKTRQFFSQSVKVCAILAGAATDSTTERSTRSLLAGYTVFFRELGKVHRGVLFRGDKSKPRAVSFLATIVHSSFATMGLQILRMIKTQGCSLFLGPPTNTLAVNVARFLIELKFGAMVTPVGWAPEVTMYGNAFSLQTPPQRVFTTALDTALKTAEERNGKRSTVFLVQENVAYAKAICSHAKT
jgi:hypothetical protein